MVAKKWKDYCMGETLQKNKWLIINNAINPEAKKKNMKIRTHKFKPCSDKPFGYGSKLGTPIIGW